MVSKASATIAHRRLNRAFRRHGRDARLSRQASVTAIVRDAAWARLPAGANIVVANPLQQSSYTDAIGSADMFVHLIGAPHQGKAISGSSILFPFKWQ